MRDRFLPPTRAGCGSATLSNSRSIPPAPAIRPIAWSSPWANWPTEASPCSSWARPRWEATCRAIIRCRAVSSGGKPPPQSGEDSRRQALSGPAEAVRAVSIDSGRGGEAPFLTVDQRERRLRTNRLSSLGRRHRQRQGPRQVRNAAAASIPVIRRRGGLFLPPPAKAETQYFFSGSSPS